MQKIYLTFFITLLLSGCAALKKRDNAPQVREEVPLNVSESADFTLGEWPAHNWWIVFQDDQLTTMMEKAISENPDLKASLFRMQSAQAEAQKVRSALFPQFNAKFKDDYEHLSKDSLFRYPPSPVPAHVNQIDLALNFEYEIDLFGKNRERYRAAMGMAKAQSAEMAQSLLMITTLLAETYFGYQATLAELKMTRDLVEARVAYEKLVSLRVQNGLDNEIARDNAESTLLSVKERVVILEKEMALKVSQLKILMGLGPDAPYTIEPPLANFNRPFPLPEDIPANLLSRRPDLMAQIWRVESFAHLIGAAKAAFFPNINLAALVGFESLSWNNLLTGNSIISSLAPAINLPIFTGGKLTAGLEESQANFDAAVYDYNNLLLKASKEVSDQIKVVRAMNQQSALQGEVLNKTTHISDLTFKRYQNGLDDYLQVLNSQVNLLNEGIKEVAIQNQRHLALLNLIKALGGGFENGSKP